MVQVPPWAGPGLDTTDAPLTGTYVALLDLLTLSSLAHLSPQISSQTIWSGSLPAHPPPKAPPRFCCYSPSFLKVPTLPEGSVPSTPFHFLCLRDHSLRGLPPPGLVGVALPSRRPRKGSLVLHLLILCPRTPGPRYSAGRLRLVPPLTMGGPRDLPPSGYSL